MQELQEFTKCVKQKYLSYTSKIKILNKKIESKNKYHVWDEFRLNRETLKQIKHVL